MKFLVPPLGEDVPGGTIHWLVKQGDAVRKGQGLVEIETELAVCEIPSPFDGLIVSTFIDEGGYVAVREGLLEIDSTYDDVPLPPTRFNRQEPL
jgi:pyruvate dehydrogenase E2 component (dihydrolipoamide acetyltransferase)